MKKILILLTITLLSINLSAQDQHLIDSLETQLKKYSSDKVTSNSKTQNIQDTTIANLLFDLSKAHWDWDNEKALDYANKCYSISEKIGYKKGIGNAYHSMGIINEDNDDYLQADRKSTRLNSSHLGI